MPTRNINLTERYDKFVSQQIAAGKYRNASEVLRAGLNLLEQQTLENEEKLATLRALTAEARAELDQGQGIRIATRKQLDSLVAQASRRGAKKSRPRQNAG